MSQINDALKRAKKMQQPDLPSGAAPLPPIEPASRNGTGWLFPLVVILLITAACIFIGLAFAGRKPAAETTPTVPATQTLTPGK